MIKSVISSGAIIAVFASVGLMSGFGASRVAAANESSQTPITITIPTRTIVYNPPGHNVTQLAQKNVPNGKYRASIEVTNARLYTGNTILVISGQTHDTNSQTSTHQLTFSEVGAEARYRKTAPQTLIVDQGKVLVSVAVGSKLSGDKTFSGDVKLTLTPTTPQVRATTAQQSAQNTTSQNQSRNTLPATGPGSIFVAFAITSGLGYAAHYRLLSRAEEER